MKILVIIPAYNEAKNIEKVISDIKNEKLDADVLVINDGSSDKTSFVVEKIQETILINLPYNLGIGGAVQAGFKYAKENGYDIVVRVDGDGQHLAEGIKKIVGLVLNKEADMIIGSRFLSSEKPPSILVRRIGQKIIGFLISVILRQKITDATSGFRCYNKRTFNLLSKYYSSDYPEPEEIIFLKKNKFKIKEVGVLMKSREEGSSSLTIIRLFYYVITVILSIFISILRTPVTKE